MPKKLDLTNQRFGRLVVLEPAPNKKSRTQWKCKCDCGNECIAATSSLRNGRKQSCGCLHSEKVAERNRAGVDSLIGQRFGKLVVLSQVESRWGHARWLCQCDCGNQKEVGSTELKYGQTLSCGCLKSSFGEKKIAELLNSSNIRYKKEYEFKDLLSESLVPLRFDFALLDSENKVTRIIEYDGEQHYLDKPNQFWSNDSLARRKKRDAIKNQYCFSHNIPIVRIPYWEKNNLSLDLLLGDKYLVQE